MMAPSEYHSAYIYTFLLLPGIAFTGLSYIGQSLLHIKNKTKTTGFTIGIISGISVLLNLILIQHIGINGLIITYNFKLITVGLSMMYLGKKIFPIELEWRRLATIAGLLIVSFITVFLLHNSTPLVYYTILPIFMIVLTGYFYFSTFFDDNEKGAMQTFFYKALKVRLIKNSIVNSCKGHA